MKTAKTWGLKPSQWDNASDEDKAQMMAFEEVSATMAAYEDQQSEADLDKKRKKPRAGK